MEMITSGKDGSTSATGFIGVILSLVSILMAVAIFMFYFMHTGEAENILALADKVIIMLGIGSALLGTRKISGVIGSKNSTKAMQQAIEDALDKREETEDKFRRKFAREGNQANSEDPIND